MNLFTGEAADAFFGGEVTPAVHGLLHQAAAAGPEDRASLLWTAQALSPECLAVYYALYKHHAGRREFELAERAAFRGLTEAAAQCGIDEEGHPRPGAPAPDFASDGPARFWLFTLKALAFVNLRNGRAERARTFLERIERLSPDARIGDDVINALLKAAQR